MNEEQLQEQQYLDAFNNGYLIAKHEPELAAKLFKQANGENPYFNAMQAGKEQYKAEAKDWVKSFRKSPAAPPSNDLHKGNDGKKLKR